MIALNPRIENWQQHHVWIVGASSGIGAALAKRLREAGATLALSARRGSALSQQANEQDLLAPLDVRDPAALAQTRDLLLEQWGKIDLTIFCAGVYTPMDSDNIDLDAVKEALEINLLGAYNLLHTLTPQLLKSGSGNICLVSSVAGYTGLPKALAYAPSKAALINLAQIAHTELAHRGVGVFLVNPGFVSSRLTDKNDFHMPALITPEQAADAIMRGMARGKFEIHFPRRFTLAMKLFSQLPYALRFWLLQRNIVKEQNRDFR